MKLGVCIPYRDNGDGVRQGHLDRLIPHLEEFLGKQGIDFTCYVGHQIDYEKFHRSGTKNVAYLQAKKDGCDYFACLLYTSPSPRDRTRSRMPSSA